MSVEFIELVESILPEDWEIHDPDMSPDFLLATPCGNVIEQDGRCSKGCCVSPMIAAGLV